MQQIAEGQINEPVRENTVSDESNLSTIDVVPEEIPNELGHEWRVLHPFELPGVRLDFTPLNVVTPSIEEEVEVEEDRNGLPKDQ